MIKRLTQRINKGVGMTVKNRLFITGAWLYMTMLCASSLTILVAMFAQNMILLIVSTLPIIVEFLSWLLYGETISDRLYRELK